MRNLLLIEECFRKKIYFTSFRYNFFIYLVFMARVGTSDDFKSAAFKAGFQCWKWCCSWNVAIWSTPLATKAFLVWNQFHLSLIKVKPLKKYNHIWVFHTSSNHNNNEKIKCLFLWRFSNYKLSQQLISNHSFEYIIILCTPDR